MAKKQGFRSLWSEYRRQLLTLLVLTLAAAALPLASGWSDIEGRAADPQFVRRFKSPRRLASAKVVIVQVGPPTYKVWSQESLIFWPLHFGPLIANLRSPSRYGAKLVGLDYVLRWVAGPSLADRYGQPNDRWPETRLIQAMESYGGVVLGMTDQEQPDPSYLNLGRGITDTALLSVREDSDALSRKIITYRKGDADGGGSAVQPGLAAAMALRSTGGEPRDEAALRRLTDVETTSLVDGRDYTVGESRINFYGPNNSSIPRVEALDVELGTLKPEQAALLKDALVLVGTAAPEDHDIRSGPGHARFDGVELHAQALASFLEHRPLKTWSTPMHALVAGVAALLAGCATLFGAILIRKLSPALFAVPGILVAGLLFGLEQWAASRLFDSDTLLPTAAAVSGLVLGCGGQIIAIGLVMLAQKRELEKFFSQHVGGAVLRRITQDGHMPPLQRDVVTVLFTDIRGFTRTASDMEPELVAGFLNQYFEAIVQCVYRNGGFVDKFIGDAVMAFWNAPERQVDHAERAVKAAVEMAQAIEVLDKERLNWGIEKPVRIGIGINTGEAVIGNLGSRDRNNFTVIGNAVNLASRIEALTKDFKATVLVGQGTFDQLGRNIDYLGHAVDIRGFQGTQMVYQIKRMDDVRLDETPNEDSGRSNMGTRALSRSTQIRRPD